MSAANYRALHRLPPLAGLCSFDEAMRPGLSVEECVRRGVGALTLFAFSSENWQRPGIEVSSLMQLFLEAMDREVEELNKNKVRLRFIGDRQSLSVKLQARMAATEELTAAQHHWVCACACMAKSSFLVTGASNSGASGMILSIGFQSPDHPSSGGAGVSSVSISKPKSTVNLADGSCVLHASPTRIGWELLPSVIW